MSRAARLDNELLAPAKAAPDDLDQDIGVFANVEADRRTQFAKGISEGHRIYMAVSGRLVGPGFIAPVGCQKRIGVQGAICGGQIVQEPVIDYRGNLAAEQVRYFADNIRVRYELAGVS